MAILAHKEVLENHGVPCGSCSSELGLDTEGIGVCVQCTVVRRQGDGQPVDCIPIALARRCPGPQATVEERIAFVKKLRN